jgi:signal transduction histidine kinase
MSDVNFAELISKIAHELRSPLTSVKGFSSTLVSRWDRFTDEQRFELVETIHADAERMGRIVSEVLDLARLESSRLELHRTTIHVAGMVTKASEHLAKLTGAGRVVNKVPAELTAHADGERIMHVISNLIENAIKFSDEGPITIDGSVEGPMTRLVVTDQGVGIAPDRVDHIFSGPAPTGQRATPSGTGLGLYLSRRLAEAHGGSLSVVSTDGQGSVFTLDLPAAADEDPK